MCYATLASRMNEGSGKALRERDRLLFRIAEIVRLFQAYDPDTLRFLYSGPVSKVLVVRINKKEKS